MRKCKVCGSENIQCMVSNHGDPLHFCKLHGDIHLNVGHSNPNWWMHERKKYFRGARVIFGNEHTTL